MNQGIWCPYHDFIHERRDRPRRALVSGGMDHRHQLDVWFTSDDAEVVECTICGEQWGGP